MNSGTRVELAQLGAHSVVRLVDRTNCTDGYCTTLFYSAPAEKCRLTIQTEADATLLFPPSDDGAIVKARTNFAEFTVMLMSDGDLLMLSIGDL